MFVPAWLQVSKLNLDKSKAQYVNLINKVSI